MLKWKKKWLKIEYSLMSMTRSTNTFDISADALTGVGHRGRRKIWKL